MPTAAKEVKKSPYEVLSAINIKEYTKGIGDKTYLPWAWAWAKLKEHYPKSYYTIYENDNHIFYFTDGKTCWVKTGVTVVDDDYSQEYVEYLPVMDNRNQSVPLAAVTSTSVNKAIQRSLTKACARHGLGLYIYAGEDLPEADAQKLTTLRENITREFYRCVRKGAEDEMSRDEQIAFQNTHVVPILGKGVNFKVCSDEDKLNQLLEHLKTL